mgnify:CR=1 FL=1
MYKGKLEEGELTKHGYHLDKSLIARHRALNKSVKEDGYVTVIRRLNLLRIFNKKNKDKYDLITSDMEYLRKKYK